ALWPLDELILDRRAPLEDAGEVLDALLARIGGFRGAHCIRHVTDEDHAELLCLVGRREVPIARDERLDLDEVDALVREVIDPPTPIRRVCHRRGTRKARYGAIEHGAGDDHPRSEKPPG